MTYEWILFDADETLFSFDALCGLQRMFLNFGIQFTPQDHEAYQLINKPLWVAYQNGHITARHLQTERFAAWAALLQVEAEVLNSAFMIAMAEICRPLTGAVKLLDALQGRVKLGIITNGFTELQQVRLERTGLKNHFEFIVISEEIGVAKPHRGIFDHALNLMGNPQRDRVLMVGDNVDADILGGLNAGLATCWLNPHNKPNSLAITPHHEVRSLTELQHLLFFKNLV